MVLWFDTLLQVAMVLKMWKTGFSVDDGPLREYQDEANKQFLTSVRQGSELCISP